METIKGTTPSGWQYELSEAVFDNMELVDALAEMEENPGNISIVCKLLLGDKRKAYYDHIRAEDGRVPLAVVSSDLEYIFSTSQPGKK